MNLLELRKKLVELSGLYDLVKDYEAGDYSDNGANFFIESGQKWLDGLMDTPTDFAEFPTNIVAGQTSVVIGSARSIKSVRVENDDDGVTYLTKVSMKSILTEFGDGQTIDEALRGDPGYYAIGTYRRATSANVMRESLKKLFILPPADNAFDVVVEGKYFSVLLTEDEQFNWWTLNYPDVLIQAALFKKESFYRNTQGLADWKNAIEDAVSLIDFDVAEEESNDIDQVKPSWNFRETLPHINRGT